MGNQEALMDTVGSRPMEEVPEITPNSLPGSNGREVLLHMISLQDGKRGQ